jgi:hypothetical protein
MALRVGSSFGQENTDHNARKRKGNAKMARRLRSLGIVMALIGLVFLVIGVYGATQVEAGKASLQAFSKAQDIALTYDDNGNLVDRGKTEGADAIKTLLVKDWDYPVKSSELTSADPLVNTPSEYMYQMATISYHVMHGKQTVKLDKPVEYNGQVYNAGAHEFDVDGRYWTDFDRQNPVEGPARDLAWTPTALALIAELGVGAVTASALQLGFAMSAMMLALGVAFLVLGGGLVWAIRGQTANVEFRAA